ncbi:MAG: serine hydrolase [Eubacteriales bacterium]|nr:serine hydrolase [Eubacteriales bacterium]
MSVSHQALTSRVKFKILIVLLSLCLLTILGLLLHFKIQSLPQVPITIEAMENRSFEGINLHDTPTLVARIDKDQLTPLFEAGDDILCPPASLAKLFLIDYLLEKYSYDDVFHVYPDALELVPENSSLAWLGEGDYSLRDLIAALLVPSGNDAAYAIAVDLGRRLSGDLEIDAQTAVDRFLEDFHAHLKKRSYDDTTITNPSGFSYDDLSSLKDLSKVILRLYQDPELLEMSKHAIYNFTWLSGYEGSWKNTNECLDQESPYYEASVIGIKTGSLEGIFNLACISRLHGHDYLILTLGASSNEIRYENTVAIIQALRNMESK